MRLSFFSLAKSLLFPAIPTLLSVNTWEYCMRILLVDDDPQILRALSRFLIERDFTTLTAANAHQALRCLAEQTPDLVISDVKMPDLSGIELLQTVRLRFPGIPVILMTGHGDQYAVQALQHRAFSYLKKPVSLIDLLAAIEQVAEGARLEGLMLEKSRALLWPEAPIPQPSDSPDESG